MSDIENYSFTSLNAPSDTDIPLDNSRVAPCSPHIAKPCALGLFSFASTMIILSTYNVWTGFLDGRNVIIGMAIFFGGATQLLAGMWEFPHGNTYGGTIFSSYGAFWMSYAAIYIPSFGILDAYNNNDDLDDELNTALAMYFFSWMIISIIFLITSIRRSISFTVLFICLSLTYMFFALSELSSSPYGNNKSDQLGRLGGVFGIAAASIAYYVGLTELLASEVKAIPLPTLEWLFKAVGNLFSKLWRGSSQ
ncbi:Gpr1 family protein [Armillaria mellea]|nr:Gpr1 family protein [Armillaria mellea]